MFKKIKEFFNKNNQLLITILGSIAIISVIYILQEVIPFGKNSLLTIDFFHQYGPMLTELAERIKNGNSLIYSFNMGMGLPFFRNFFNYLSSPFNLLILLFEHKDILSSFSIIIGLKSVAAATTMIIYLKNKFKNKSLLLIPLALLYSCSAYFIAYYWNIMWLDGLVFLPLITLGIEQIIDKDDFKIYIISLAVMLFANYFIGYMICIFSVLYFIAYLIIETKEFKIKTIITKLLKFALYSLLAGGLCAIFLIPMYYGLQNISATSDVFPTSQYYAFTLKDFIFNHFSGVGSTVLSSGNCKGPNISCGVLSVALLLLFIINPKIKLKTKLCYVSLLLILAISFISGPLDFIWHAFHVPNDLPFRYSFIYSFIIITISAYSIMNIKDIKPIFIHISYIFLLGVISIFFFIDFPEMSSDMITLNYIILTIAYLCYIIFHYFKGFNKYIAPILIITAVLECTIVTNNNWSINQIAEEFYSDYDNTQNALTYVRDNDDEMYRLEKTAMLSFNDPSWYNYYGVTTFSSMEYENMAVLAHKLGLPGNEINSYYYKNTTPLYDLMFNVKYFIGSTRDNQRYSIHYNSEDILLYKNLYNVGLMYGVDSNIKNWKYNLSNPFEIQNDFIKQTTGIDKLLYKIKNNSSQKVYQDNTKVIMKYTITNPDDNLYFYYDSSNIDFIIVDGDLYYSNSDYEYIKPLLNKIEVFSYIDYNEKYIINTRNYQDTYSFYVGYNNYYQDNVSAYSINNDEFIKAYNILNNKKVNIVEFNEHYINAKYNCTTNETIYTSIPYDEGWKVLIDGKETKTFTTGNALLAFDITKGNHKIELKYKIPKLNIGIIISSLSLITFILLIIKKRKVHN